jgi:hypothetical protein
MSARNPVLRESLTPSPQQELREQRAYELPRIEKTQKLADVTGQERATGSELMVTKD